MNIMKLYLPTKLIKLFIGVYMENYVNYMNIRILFKMIVLKCIKTL